MGTGKQRLPKTFQALLNSGDTDAIKAVFTQCDPNATGGYGDQTAICFPAIPDEIVEWLVARGAEINFRDKHGETPLHHQASSWCGNVGLLLRLGADIAARDQSGATPLHTAAGCARSKAVRELVAQGADVHAVDKNGNTPLACALNRCANTNIMYVAEIAAILLGSGDTVTPEMQKAVSRIGQEFEFYREKFNRDLLDETERGLAFLYRQFDVKPVPRRTRHDGISPISVTTTRWQDQHNELWNLLVPASGPADTVQGELIRVTGRISHEILDNGGVNWDQDYRNMLKSVIQYVGMGTALDFATRMEVTALVDKAMDGTNMDAPARLSELAVQWVLRNPEPIGIKLNT